MQETLEQKTVSEAIEARATDIHIDPTVDGFTVRFRVDGMLRTWRPLGREVGERLINQIKADVGIEPGTIFEPVGVRRKWRVGSRDIDLRVTVAPCVSGPKVAIRLLDRERIEKRIPSLGLLDDHRERLEKWISELNGMVLVTGPTASGKTTTLYALLHELATESRHVITVEDPVEYEIDGINQIQVDERHGLDFAEGIRTTLRLDPDCLMIGEIRDKEAAHQGISAAVHGHVVLASMHSRDAVSAITRLRNFGLEDFQVAAAVGVIVNQRLVRKICQQCSQPRQPVSRELTFLSMRDLEIPDRVYEASGCDACDGTGYFGRTGIFEIWHIDGEDYEAILAGTDEQGLRDRLDESGHRSLLADVHAKIASGLTTVDEAIRAGLDLPWQAK